jgi:hypothetical protein
MRKATTGATMSLDGFIADAHHGGFDYLFKWYVGRRRRGPHGPPGPDGQGLRRQRGAPVWLNQRLGALACGRRLYDMTNAWGGRSPLDLTTVVVTHQRPQDRPPASTGELAGGAAPAGCRLPWLPAATPGPLPAPP